MKFVSWNVNGLKARLKNEQFISEFKVFNADIFALQEIRTSPNNLNVEEVKKLSNGFNDYYQCWNISEVKGNFGTAIFTRIKPMKIIDKINFDKYDREGRIMTLEFEKFFFVNLYAPFVWSENYSEWLATLRNFLINLNKSTIIGGDFNMRLNDKKESEAMKILCGNEFVIADKDGLTYRHQKDDNKFTHRLDYFVVSKNLMIKSTAIFKNDFGSDHLPISLEVNL